MDGDLSSFRCRCCRKFLFSTEDIDEHTTSTDVSCTSWYLKHDSTKWVMEAVQKSQWTAGKLYCPKCHGRVGAFNFLQGVTCICGKFIIPAVWVQKSRVDHSIDHVLPYISQPKLSPCQKSCVSTLSPQSNVPGDSCQVDQVVYDSKGDRNAFINSSCNYRTMSTQIRNLNTDLRDSDSLQYKKTTNLCTCRTSDGLQTQCEICNLKNDAGNFGDLSVGHPLKVNHRTYETFVVNCPQDISTQSVKTGSQQKRKSLHKKIRDPETLSYEQESEHAINEHFVKNLICRKKRKKTKIRKDCNTVDTFRSTCSYERMENKDEEGEKTKDLSSTYVQEHHLCPICLDLLYEPCQCQCGHVFCDPCLRQLNYKSQFQNIKCPMCRKVVERHLPDTELRNEIKILYPELYRARHKAEHRAQYRRWPLPSIQMSSLHQPRQVAWQSSPPRNIIYISLLFFLLTAGFLLIRW